MEIGNDFCSSGTIHRKNGLAVKRCVMSDFYRPNGSYVRKNVDNVSDIYHAVRR